MSFPTATVTQGSGLTINTLPNSGQATMTNSLSVAIASDQNPLPIASTPVAVAQSMALESSHLFKTGAGKLLDTYCLATVAGYYMLFDATSAPADGAVTPLAVINVGAGETVSFSYPPFFPLSFATGLVGVFSTNGPFTKTASATAYMSGRVI